MKRLAIFFLVTPMLYTAPAVEITSDLESGRVSTDFVCGQTVYARAGWDRPLEPHETLEVRWIRPDGSLLETGSFTFATRMQSSWVSLNTRPRPAGLRGAELLLSGTWRVELHRKDSPPVVKRFTLHC
jgi:hypothetical protein